MTKCTNKYTTVNGIKTRYCACGEQGPVILLIHGFVGSIEHWTTNIEALAKNHRVYALDMIGFGYTDKPQNLEYNDELFVQFIKNFIDTLGLKKINLIGHSLGGAVCLGFAIKYPVLLSKLVLVSSAGFGKDLPLGFRLLTLPLIGELIMHFDSRFFLTKAFRSHVYNKDAITTEFINKMYSIFHLPDFKKTMLKILRNHANFHGIRPEALSSILKQLHKIKIPTLIIWGKQDSLLSISHSNAALKLLPHAELHIFDNCGHMPQLEVSKEFNELITRYINN